MAKSTQSPTSLDNEHGVLMCAVDVCDCAIHEHMVWAWRQLMASGQMMAINVGDRE